MSRGSRALVLGMAALSMACGQGGADALDREPLVFAAASLRTALDEIEPVCRERAGTGFRASFAGSAALARQIQSGAPADIFISADLDWMDAVAADGLIQPETRVSLLSNGLVLIAPASQQPTPRLSIEPGFRLAEALGDGRLALADPGTVPAGKYAKAALISLGVWTEVADRVAPADNVRGALLLVSRREAPFGIVYRTDAAADPGVVVVGTFTAGTHPAIVYPAALTRDAAPASRRVLDCLRSAEARARFERWGFGVISGSGHP